MLTYKECIELREKFLNGEISLESAEETLDKNYQKGQRSWHTKDWKERRLKFLKEKCEICNCSDTLTIQHLSHPKKYAQFKREVTSKHTKLFKENNFVIEKDDFKEFIIKNYDYRPVPLCPKCCDNRPSKRVVMLPKYRCKVQECQYEFDKPVSKSLDELITIFYENEEAIDVRDKCFVSIQWGNTQNLSNIKYWFQREKAKTQEAEIIGKESILLYLDDQIKYLSFQDAITACKKCASYYDLKNMELCPSCKEHYKGIQYPTCISCLPDDKRNSASETIEFGKKIKALRKEFGID